MYKIDELINDTTQIDDRWIIARPIKASLKQRVKDAIQVIKGNADAVTFYKQ
jgi:hypothetical protein